MEEEGSDDVSQNIVLLLRAWNVVELFMSKLTNAMVLQRVLGNFFLMIACVG